MNPRPAGLIKQVTELLLQKKDFVVMATLAEPSKRWRFTPIGGQSRQNAHKEALWILAERRFLTIGIQHCWPTNKSDEIAPKTLIGTLGIYAYRVSLLPILFGTRQLEQLESLEQLRILEQGMRIAIDIASELLPPV